MLRRGMNAKTMLIKEVIGKKQREIKRSKGKDSRWRAHYGLTDFDGYHNATMFESSFSSTFCTIVCRTAEGYCATTALTDCRA